MNRLPVPDRFHRLMLYACVGGLGTAAHYAVLICLVEFFGWEELHSTSLGFVIGAIVNYTLNYYITFKSDRSHFGTMVRFAAIAFLGFLLNGFLFYHLTGSLQIHYLPAQVVSTLGVMLVTYQLNRNWTY